MVSTAEYGQRKVDHGLWYQPPNMANGRWTMDYTIATWYRPPSMATEGGPWTIVHGIDYSNVRYT